MRRIRIAGLCLVAVFVVSVAMSATASAAAPEFGRCIKKAKAEGTGFSDAGCTKAVTGATAKYEWAPGFGAKNKFTTTGGAPTLATKGDKTVTCTSETSSGKYVTGSDNKHETTTVEFAGCKSN